MTREERKVWYYNQTHKTIDGIIYKQCTRCNEFKPMDKDSFYT
ncbi:MAG: hypothetical protein PHT02_00585 [Tissierellia bacterium]|nr:hypothetical protein [Tissierellia bacterium]